MNIPLNATIAAFVILELNLLFKGRGWPLGIKVEIEVDFDGLRSKKHLSDWLTRLS